MLNIEQFTSNFIESQFPSFYQEEGPLFVLFAKEYYEWLEKNYNSLELSTPDNFNIGDTVTQTGASGIIEAKQDSSILVRVISGSFRCNTECLNDVTLVESSAGGSSYVTKISSSNVTYHSRNLLRYRDLDSTTNRFLVHFKEKYLKNIQFDTATSKKLLVKAAQELYSSKGTERSIDLLFKLVYGAPSTVYYPGDDLFTLSSGKWILPKYLEVTRSSRTMLYANKTVFGSLSGASAFCEYIITRNIKGKIIDVLYLTDIKGTFETGESVLDDTTTIKGAPLIVGSLSNVDITTGGELFSVGEEVRITSVNGVGATATVREVTAESGLVRFSLVDGGWGYSNTGEILISQKVFNVSNVLNSNASVNTFFQFETITQDLKTVIVNNAIGNITSNSLVYNPDNNYGVIVSVAQNTNSNTATLIVNGLSGNLQSNGILRLSNSVLLTIASNNTSNVDFAIGEVIRQSNGTANVSFGVLNSISNAVLLSVNTSTISANGIHPGVYARQTTTLATGRVTALPFELYNNYTQEPYVVLTEVSGTFSNTNEVLLYTSNTFTTRISDFDPLNASNAQLIKLTEVTGSRWYSGNTIYGQFSGEINQILVSTDIGGIIQSCIDVTASANVIGYNTTHIGIISVSNTFYTSDFNVIIGQESNTYAKLETTYTGQGANADIFNLVDTEQVRINTDFISANNDGFSSQSVQYRNMQLLGANSTYGYIKEVFVANGGSGYTNNNLVIISGGNTGVGSYEASNGTIITNDAGSIVSVSLANTGNGYSTYPTVYVANSTGGNTGVGSGAEVYTFFPLGFPKLTVGTFGTRLVDLLSFETKTVGTITSLKNINPGENYNIVPFVVPYERGVAEYSKRDYQLIISNPSRSFIVGELVTQSIEDIGKQFTCNVISGSASLQNKEFIYTTDGINYIGLGELYSFTGNSSTNTYVITLSNTSGSFQNTVSGSLLTLNNLNNFVANDTITQGTATGTIVQVGNLQLTVRNVTGSFAVNSTPATSTSGGSSLITAANNAFRIYSLFTTISNTQFFINNVQNQPTSLVAKGRVAESNSTSVIVKRTTLFDEFAVSANNDLLGQLSSANAKIDFVGPYLLTLPIGLNANITANVITTNGSISSLTLVDSGFGFIDDEGLEITSLDGLREATAKATVRTNGVGTGYYSSRHGFLSDQSKIHDGEYYQQYSYEVQSPIPLDKYQSMLLEVLHVAGTRMFGRVSTKTTVNNFIGVANSTITIE